MGVAMKEFKTMDWSRFTIDGWLEQYGAYIQTSRMKSGNEPDDLGINQIYWLICENNKGVSTRRDKIACEIDDYEAEEVRKLIVGVYQSKMICASAKSAVKLFIEKNVRGMSLDQMQREFTLSRSSINNMIYAGKFYLAGHDKRLKID